MGEIRMRLFIAVDVPPEVKRAVGRAQKELPEKGGLKRVELPMMHITLKFLGEVSPRMLDRVDGVLREISFSPFRVKVRGVGVFPNKKYIRVVWAGCEGQELAGLAGKMNEKLGGMFPEDTFSPHITMARVKRDLVLDDYLKKYGNERFGEFSVREFHLVESVLGPGGAKYNTLATYSGR